MMYIKLFLAVLVIIFMLSNIVIAKDIKKDRVKLIFSIDQVFSNGILVNNDMLALKNIINAVKPLKKYYDVYLLLDPMIKDKSKLYTALDLMKKYDQDFVFDVMTSDVQALSGYIPYLVEPYDKYHGLVISVKDLSVIKKKYGKHFAGIRFMETFGADFSTRCAKTDSQEEWVVRYREMFPIPEDNYLQSSNIEDYMKFAKENNMFAEWTDFHWSSFADWDAVQKDNEIILANAIKKYPDTTIVCYSNNEPLELSVPRVGDFDNAVRKYLELGAAGIGLSNQSWIRSDCMSTDSSEIISWCESALNKGCILIQFEPSFYFFDIPLGALDKEIKDYRADYPKGNQGKGTDNFKDVRDWLLRYSRLKESFTVKSGD